AATFCLLLLIGRGLRGAYLWIGNLLDRWFGRRASLAVGWIVVAGLAYLAITGLLLQGLVAVANSAFSVRDTTTAAGVHQPATSLRSGGPGSLIAWDTPRLSGAQFRWQGTGRERNR